MIKRTLYFSSPCRLSLKNEQLIVESLKTGAIKSSPIEDLGFILIEDQQVSISIPALNALSENNCSVVFCDKKHMPVSMLMNLDSNSTQAETYRFQVDAGLPLKKVLWKQIIESKIRNQANLLDKVGKDGSVLKPFYSNIKSGDVDNKEGLSAKLYWNALFGNEFKREREGSGPNNMLNYGYSILRAAMTRAIMGSGLFPAFGLFHKNRYNAFPLADDLMEPYRPFVDQIVYRLYTERKTELSPETKQELIRVMFVDTSINTITRPLEISLSISSASLAKCLRGEQKVLSFPLLQ